MDEQRFYSQEDAEEILRLASRQQFEGGVTLSDLQRMAGELGLSPDAIQRAEAELAAQSAQAQQKALEQQKWAEFKERYRHSYVSEVLSSLSFVTVMTFIWYFTSHGHGHFWPIWIIMIAGLNIITKTFRQLDPHARRRAFEKYLKKGVVTDGSIHGEIIIGHHGGRRLRDESDH
ncbi:MAG: hypothetical protein JSS72_09610 [Armatimonadetes bacterium]|nr:hypothetical protein [Armatimonadota bacterium]